MSELDDQVVGTLRFLSVDMVEAAKSGHPGLPLGAAPMAHVLWSRFLRHDPADPNWPDRDRFVLSAGHGSALLYSLLHVSGYDLPIEQLRSFRQYGSRTPGHPEAELTAGVEVTTGPLGQGFGMGVGLALAEKFLGHAFNREGFPVVDHRVYGLVSDGDLMEGISSEAASYAATAGLGKLFYLYDANQVSLEGPTELTFTEDVLARFRSYGWDTREVPDGNDRDAIDGAIRAAARATDRPHLIQVRTHIGYGSPKQDTKDAHGEPLGAAAARAAKERLGWPVEPPFYIPPEIAEYTRSVRAKGGALHTEWRSLLSRYRSAHPDLAEMFERALAGRLPDGWDRELPRFDGREGELATRDASAKAVKSLVPHLPTLIGGSADLAPSTKTLMDGEGSLRAGRVGRNLHFGVREHAMAAAVNGMAMHGGVIPYGATFLVFADYARPAIRLGALMRAHGLFLFTHDSIGLGEDGPTHQPIEHLWSLRSIPGLTLFRPADANETVEAWRAGIPRPGPVLFVFTRQKLPVLDVEQYPIRAGVPRGGYTLREASRAPELVLLATGSEVHLTLAAQAALEREGTAVRVVSMPSVELFEENPPEYRQSVIPPGLPCLAIEAGSPLGWWKYVGARGDVLGLERFGASAPGPTVYANLGFSVENVVARGRALLGRSGDLGSTPTSR
ncbi:MAG TPA: transketolase [Thermoplasmata archaeon]|nr:transketolase [Thermoplasmata archaeon]